MALTKVSRGLLSTGIVDNSNATAITLNADESATFTGTVAAAALSVDATTGSNAGITIRMGTANSGANDSFIGFQNSAGTEVFRTRYDNPTTSYAISSDTSGDILTLQRGGNVGISTTNPQKTLDVLGEIAISNSATSYWNLNRDDSTGALTISDTGSERFAIAPDGAVTLKPNGITTGLRLQGRSSDNNFFIQFNSNNGSTNYAAIGVDSANSFLQFASDKHKFVNQATNSEYMRIDGAVTIIGSSAKTFGGIDASRLAVVGGSNSSSNAVQMIVDEDGSVEGGSTLLAIGFSGDNSFSTANYINFFDSGGQQGRIEGTGSGAVSYQSGSDARLKSNIRDTASKWDALRQIQVRDFEWAADTSNKTVTGFIAQELHSIFPDAVSEGGEDVTKKPWAVDYGRTSPIVIKALQEAMDRIETLEAKVQTLEAN